MSEENIQTPAPVVETIDQIPTKLPVLPLRDVVIYPYMIFPVLVGRESSLKAAAAAMERGKNIFLVAQKNASVDDPGPDDVYKDGTVAKIIQMLKLPNGLMKILVDGLVQASAKEYHPRPEYLEAEIAINRVELPADKEIEALIHTPRPSSRNTSASTGTSPARF